LSQSIRQSELFAGQDWQVLYRAFTDVNFNASDPPSINRALRDYIQQNYPENFNDWIESSEFVALIDLLSWLAGTLAFKTDLNARESFLETAESRLSILRLARFISYNPRRNQTAQGLVKLVEVMTDDDVLDGFGTNLNGSTIQWDNPDDPDWFERFVLVLNSAYISTNPFGVPLKDGDVSGIDTQLYRVNNLMSEANLGFAAKVNGSSMDFEVVNGDFDDGGGFSEREPDYQNAFHMFYRNDGNGNSSGQTGFFMMFKQGTLQRNVFSLPTPVENNVLDIDALNVNDTDVWVQTVTDSGNVLQSWSKVPALFNENITYNNFDPTIRDIFSVITRTDDAISVRFSDGRFGTVPTGNIRVFYRVSNGQQYQIRPTDMNRVKLSLPYYNRAGVKKTLTLTFSLQSAVSNSTPRETDDQIKARAPSVYATQNRMVSGEDYNTFPLQSNLAVKLKAINRIYSGHSRFIDLNDPTGTYQDVDVFADDGLFFREPYDIYTEVPMSLAPSAGDIVSLYIQPVLTRQEVLNYAQDYLLHQSDAIMADVNAPFGIIWNRADSDVSFSSTGYFSDANLYLVEGAIVEFDSNGTLLWATISNITGTETDPPPAGTAGPVTLSLSVPDGATISRVIPRFNSGLDAATSTAMQTFIRNNQSFTLWFDYAIDPSTNVPSWVLSPETPTATSFEVMTVTYGAGGVWSIIANGLRYVFESLKKVQWYNDGRKTVDSETGVETMDYVRVLKINENLAAGEEGQALPKDYDLAVNRIYINRDGSADPTRVTVSFADYNLNGFPDDPTTFESVTDPRDQGRYLFWQNSDVGYVPLVGAVNVFETEALRRELGGDSYDLGAVAFQISANAIATRENTFWVKTTEDATDEENGWVIQRQGAYTYGIGRGPNVAATWTGAPNTQQPGNPLGNSPDWEQTWEEILPPVWITPGGSLANVNEGTLIYGTLFATDPQGLPLTYQTNAALLPGGDVGNGIILDANTGVFSGRMPEVLGEQIWSFDVVATNGVLSSPRNFTMRGTDATPAPEWTTNPGSLGAYVPGTVISKQFTAIDPSSFPITYTKSSGSFPSGIFLTPDGVLSGTFPPVDPAQDPQNYAFTLRASNGLSFEDRAFTLVLTAHSPPVWQVVTANGVAGIGYNPRLGTSLGPAVTLASSDGSFNGIYQTIVAGQSALAAANIYFANGMFNSGNTVTLPSSPPTLVTEGVLFSPVVTGVSNGTVIHYTLRASYGSPTSDNHTDQDFSITIVT
jgi:hypothetical protein